MVSRMPANGTAWAMVTLAAMGLHAGAGAAIDALLHTMLSDYLSFIVLLFALYVVSGGLLVTGNLRGTPLSNAGLCPLVPCSQALSVPLGPP
jgi:hypothetical protein